MSSQEPLTLDQLDDTYEVIGEMSGRADARTFMAKRRADGADVLIAVARTPQGDEGNALSHLAADANLLSGREHRNLLPIIEGRWLGTDAFAIITERVNARSLDEVLARREEEFDYPRIALILQEVNGLLEWARSQKVVHRAIGLNTLYLEPGSDRVLVSFVVRALPLADMPGPDADAKTIAELARAMLTRSAAAPERAGLPLAELRPGLPARVVEQTDALLALSHTSQKVPDVRGYIALIAMAEPLKRSETECADTTRRLLEEERVAREEIEARRQACERTAAEQQRLFQREKEAYAKEREAAERAFAKEKEATALAFAKEKETALRALAKETESAQRALAKERETIARERASIAKERAALEQERAALLGQRTARARTPERPTPAIESEAVAFAPVLVPLSGAKRRTINRSAVRTRLPRWTFPTWRLSNWSRPKWNRTTGLYVGAGALSLLIAVTLLALGRSRQTAPPSTPRGEPVARTVESAAGVAAPLSSSSGIPADLIRGVAARINGGVVPPPTTNAVATSEPSSAALGVPADLVSGVAARAAVAPPVRPRPRPRPVVAPADTAPGAFRDTTPRLDTLLTPPGATVRSDSVVRPRPDSVSRRDAVPRRDTLPRDTLPRRDTSATRG